MDVLCLLILLQVNCITKNYGPVQGKTDNDCFIEFTYTDIWVIRQPSLLTATSDANFNSTKSRVTALSRKIHYTANEM
jgi:hypothetical protein